MYLEELNIYPIKSARGISLKAARLDAFGLEYDRRWMLVDRDGCFLTQRKLPRMALIHVTLASDHLSVDAPGLSTLQVPLKIETERSVPVTVWHDSVDALDAGEDSARWFTEILGLDCRLVFMPPDARRLVDPKYAAAEQRVSFADAFPLLLISTASLDDLNSRLTQPVTMDRFRPNLVIAGCAPYEEDSWKDIVVGQIEMHVAKPCARCAVPGVDQKTGARSDEPLRTLEKYRTQDGKVYFGQNVIHTTQGILKVGEAVTPKLPQST